MRTFRKTLVAGTAAVALLGGGVTAAVAAQAPDAVGTADEQLSPAGRADLQFTREEERMARDLYRTFADRYDGVQVFDRIAASEQMHFDAVGRLLSRYGVADPSSGKAAGVYADDAIQTLFDDWKATGLKSSDDALAVGADLEKRDIADLQKLGAKDSPSDVTFVYQRLLSASERHLTAFTAVADGDPDGLCDGSGMQRGPDGARQGGPGGRHGRMGQMGGQIGPNGQQGQMGGQFGPNGQQGQMGGWGSANRG